MINACVLEGEINSNAAPRGACMQSCGNAAEGKPTNWNPRMPKETKFNKKATSRTCRPSCFSSAHLLAATDAHRHSIPPSRWISPVCHHPPNKLTGFLLPGQDSCQSSQFRFRQNSCGPSMDDSVYDAIYSWQFYLKKHWNQIRCQVLLDHTHSKRLVYN